jgi:hypothetical protein
MCRVCVCVCLCVNKHALKFSLCVFKVYNIFDTQSEISTIIKQTDISIILHYYLLHMCLERESKIYSFSKFSLYNRILLNIVFMLYIRALGLFHLYSLISPYFLLLPAQGECHSTLYIFIFFKKMTHVGDTVPYFSFNVKLISLNLMSYLLIHVTNGRIFLF